VPKPSYLLDINGRKVAITNPDKVLYPAADFTKAHVIDYYARVSEWLLPHLKERPVTLKRYPDGVDEKHFYEKDAPSYTPDWVKTYPVPRRGGGTDIRYVLINDLATLVWSANLANLEIHPFLHRIPRLDRPDFVTFDLDPGEGADVLRCAEVALMLKEALEGVGLQALAKVSGSKGIQVSVPLNTRVTYNETQPFAHSLAQLLERAHPRLIVSEMPKELRKGKVFIDWSQNTDFKTTVSVYSLRAKRPHPFVSMPVSWDELSAALAKRDADSLYFPPGDALARLSAKGDLYAPLLKLEQKLPRKPVELRKAPATTRLDFIEPMRAKLAVELPEGGEWLYEIKFDGYRAIAVRNSGETRLLSRNKLPLESRFPEVANACEALPPGTIVDGEIVALDDKGRPLFSALQSRRSGQPVFYYVFDLLAFDHRSLLEEPLMARRKLLDSALAKARDPIRRSEALEAAPADLVAAARREGIEGLVAKRRNSRYEPGQRSGAWIKVKVNQGQELVIGGYIPGPHGFTSLLVGYYEARKLIFIAKVKNGFVPHVRQAVYERMKPLETDDCPFANLPEPKNARRGEALTAEVMKKCRWVKPELVAQIEYVDWTAANHLRHSRFAGLRDDKDPHEVRRERAE
jgi:bifunctional non-homologous end joining protein LigD